MAERGANMSGAERAAVLLMSLGEADAAAILKHMDPRDVEAVGLAMANLPSVTRDRAEGVVQSFLQKIDSGDSFGADKSDFVKKVMSASFGKQRGELMVDRILSGGVGGAGIDALRWMDPRAVAQLIGDEHPQVIASLMAQLDGKLSAKIVPLLPEKQRADVLMRIATLEELPQSALQELDQIVGKRAASGAQVTSRRIGGTRTVADIINAMDRETSNSVLGQIESENAELHTKIKELLFVFDDLADIDNKGIQAVLREVSSDILSVALRGADPVVAEKIYGNMSKRAAEILREDMEARGPVKLTEVEAAQREIVVIAQKLAEEGTIILGASAGEYV
ncbi:MAG: flagellar motor switch protein FliG [Proteobacteria bacterium]|nr:flagellar motor switch protein FliG [Pseudomonadota bacterium]